MEFPDSSAGKESACNAGDLDSILGLGGSPGEGKGYPLQYSGLQNSMDSSPWGHKESDTTEQPWLSGGMSVCSPSLHSSGFMNAFPEGSSCYISRDWVCLIWCSELRRWHCYLLRIQQVSFLCAISAGSPQGSVGMTAQEPPGLSFFIYLDHLPVKVAARICPFSGATKACLSSVTLLFMYSALMRSQCPGMLPLSGARGTYRS